MQKPEVTVANWNVEWAVPKQPRFALIRNRLFETEADLICVTEGSRAILPERGYVITSEADYGYKIKDVSRRKVLLWSRQPWNAVDSLGDDELPSGRFVSGVTQSPIGLVNVIGVCIPWANAHVTTGRKDRQPWEDHVAYLKWLEPILSATGEVPRIVIGDFNQRVPRRRSPADKHECLMNTFAGYSFATAGRLDGLEKQSVNHVVVEPRLEATRAVGIPRLTEDGVRLSDHDGQVVVLRHREPVPLEAPTPFRSAATRP